MFEDILPTDKCILGYDSFLFEVSVPDFLTELQSDINLDEMAEKVPDSKSSAIRLFCKFEIKLAKTVPKEEG
ncbi:MAG: hypothetical protein EZS28_003752 [Streblomastix strix]|uniref:Uncharacterized protein n=1 Tax=Streblomastix strix TaxID=222440 RepID=A0A5J4X1W0_9EUKA|nr:MAG: hypothetical protein EZS28_003752 [Streblomastix strix]